jgi:hypothetical protein
MLKTAEIALAFSAVLPYSEIPELTLPLLQEFVERVVVYEADKSSGKREQRVDIYLNHIGQFAVPGETETEDGKEKRAMWREYKRNQRAKAKQQEPAQEGKTA